MSRLTPRQVVAYNKVDVPDSGDYFEEVRDALVAQGVDEANVLAVSAATGQGVTPLVRRLHALLDSLPVQARPARSHAPSLLYAACVSSETPVVRKFHTYQHRLAILS